MGRTGATMLLDSRCCSRRHTAAVSLVRILAVAVAVLCAVTALADDPCSFNGETVPLCQTVSNSDTIAPWRPSGDALYCPRSAAYYWGGWTLDTGGHKGITIVENAFDENASKADFDLDNFSFHRATVMITIGCSPISPSGNCTQTNQPACGSDPGCPQSNLQTQCSGVDSGDCWMSWDETCINGQTVTPYFCSTAEFATCCYSCT